MRIQDKYISPFTDFGFKKLFGSEQEYQEYEESLKVYRDLKNCIDTAFGEGEISGILKVAVKMKQAGVPVADIIQFTGLTKAEIEQL